MHNILLWYGRNEPENDFVMCPSSLPPPPPIMMMWWWCLQLDTGGLWRWCSRIMGDAVYSIKSLWAGGHCNIGPEGKRPHVLTLVSQTTIVMMMKDGYFLSSAHLALHAYSFNLHLTMFHLVSITGTIMLQCCCIHGFPTQHGILAFILLLWIILSML